MAPVRLNITEESVYLVKNIVDREMTESDGFESYLFKVGSYNSSVGPEFQLPYDQDVMALLIISTPNMFDVSFRRWFNMKLFEEGSLEAMADSISSPISQFLDYRLYAVTEKLPISFELIHDHSLWPNRKPKILMQTCGHISGAAYYYQPKHVQADNWPPRRHMDEKSKFIGLSLHPVYGGHFAFRCVFIFPSLRLPSFKEMRPLSILHSQSEIREALEKFNYSWRDSGFRDFGSPRIRYSSTQMEFFGRPPAERWAVLKQWCQ